MSTPGVVRYAVAGAVAHITFDRPASHNAMTWAMYDQLLTALDEADGNPDLRVVTLRGAGGHFVAGTDISQFESFASADDGVAYERRLEAIVARLEAVRVPSVAVVQGHAAGAGLLFAMACDLRVCSPDARFSAPIARTVGNTLSLASHARLVAHFGPSRTKSLLMTAGAMEAIEARASGFVTAVVEAERLDQHVTELTDRLAQLAPLTLRATRQLVARLLGSVVGGDEDILREVYGSRDFHEGVNAFREKRSPSWEGK